MTSLLILSSLVYPLTLLRKRISAASWPVMSRFVVTFEQFFILFDEAKGSTFSLYSPFGHIGVEVYLHSFLISTLDEDDW
jgi:hypothetical protein